MSDNQITTGIVRIFGGGHALPKFAFANVAASTTDESLVAAVSGKKIRVLSVALSCITATTTIVFNTKPAGAGTAISATFTTPTTNVSAIPFSPLGHFETDTGEGLTVTTGAGNPIGVQITYIEV